MESGEKSIPTSRLVLGITIMCLGVLFTLDNFDVINVGNIFHYWPMLLIAFGLAVFLESQRAQGLIAGTGVMAIGLLLMLNNLGLIRFRLFYLWPLVLILVGIAILWGSMGRIRVPPGGDTGSVVSVLTVLGGTERTCNSRDFRGGEITALLGGCFVDLRPAVMQADEAVLNTFAFWGGIEIRVPEDWAVSLQAFPVLGGVEGKTTTPLGNGRKTLIVKGFAIMGGIEIRN